MHNESLKVTGMTCDGCTNKVAHALKAVSGVLNVVVPLADGRPAVRYDEQLMFRDIIQSTVNRTVYRVDATNAARG